MNKVRYIQNVTILSLVCLGLLPAMARGQLSSMDVEALEMQGQEEGWTFTVSRNPATYRSLESLCEMQEPADWQDSARVNPALTEASGQRALPAAFDWRDYDGCTPVRNQGSCGSCWAFSTVGAMECAIMIDSGLSVDLSEQYLVSCNNSGYSCNGGWFAHDYHCKRAGKDGGIGAVFESAKPYTATNSTCAASYSHPYVLNSWYYISASNVVPATNLIKQAIMDYGPVSVSVTVTSAFQAYHSGVFNSSSTAAVNHAVVLVGWNDTDQAWIMRNSWGTSWGESGYMRIAYGCSKIGYGACYVDYGSGQVEGATMTSPANGATLDATTATFTWDAYEGAEEYWLGIGTAIGKYNVYKASQGTNTSVTVSNLPATGVMLYAKLFTKINGEWFGRLYTYSAVNLPAEVAVMTSPEPSSTLESSTATFTWSTGTRVTEYRLWVGTSAGGYNLYNKSLGTATTATVSNLPCNSRKLYVRLFSKIAGVWKKRDYTYTAAVGAPEAAVMLTPEADSELTSSAVQFTWSEGLGVTEYLLQIGTSNGGKNVYRQSTGKKRSALVSTIPTTGGTLYVRLYSKCGSTWQYNSYQYTTLNASSTAAAMLTPEPSSTLDSNIVTFTWDAGVGVTQYRLDIGTAANTGNLYNKTLGLNQTATVSGLPMGGRTLYVRLWSMIAGKWQKRNYTYTAVTQAAEAAAITSPTPSSTLTSSMATFEWSTGTGATEYWLRIGTTFSGVDLYNKSQGLNTSVTVFNLPRNKKTVYVRLLTKVNGTWLRNDYTYTAASSDAARPLEESE